MKGRTVSDSAPIQSPQPLNPPSSPASSGPPPTPRDDLKTMSAVPAIGKLRIVQQWMPRAQVC